MRVKGCITSGFLLALVLIMGLFLYPKTSFAQQEHVVRDSSTMIHQDQKVDDVVVVGDNAFIAGTVRDAVIVLNGNTHLYSTAKTDLVITIGGSFTQDKGAHVNQVLTLSFDSPLKNSLALGTAIALGLWACRLALSVAGIVFPVLFSIFLKRGLHTPLSFLEQSARRIGLIGLLASIGMLVVAGILGVTIVGIPIAIGIILLYLISSLIGLSVVSIWIAKLTFGNTYSERPIWQQSLIGSTLLIAFSNIPLIGPFVILALIFVSIGVTALWGWETFQKRKRRPV